MKEKIRKKCLKIIWNDIDHITRGKIFDTVEVRKVSEKAKLTLRKHKKQRRQLFFMYILPMYMGRRTSKTCIAEVLPGVDVAQLVVAVTVDLEEKITFLKTKVTEKQHWQGEAEPQNLKKTSKIFK